MLGPLCLLLAAAPALTVSGSVVVPETGPSDRVTAKLEVRAPPGPPKHALTLKWAHGEPRPTIAAKGAEVAWLEDLSAFRILPQGATPLAFTWEWTGPAAEVLELLSTPEWTRGVERVPLRLDVQLVIAASASRWRLGGDCQWLEKSDRARRCKATGLPSLRLVELGPGLALAATPHFEIEASDPVSLGKNAEAALTALVKSLGPAPRSSFSILEAPAARPGGLSLPGIVVLSPALLAARDAAAEEVRALAIAHELAHQWFGALVTFFPDEPPAIVEGLAQHLAVRALKNLPGGASAPPPRALYQQTWAAFRDSGGKDAPANQRFSQLSAPEVAALVYAKVPNAFALVEEKLGSKAFELALRKFIQTWRGKEASSGALRAAFGPQGELIRRALEDRSGDADLLYSPRDAGSSTSRTAVP
jgi:hypothetical protein